MNRSKAKGTAAETAVVRYLRTVGWPSAERRALTGALDQGDVTGTPRICWEVKSYKQYSDLDVATWMAQTESERDNARADMGVLVVRRAGAGPANAGRWWAYMAAADVAVLISRLYGDHKILQSAPAFPVRMLLADAAALLVAAGYGTADGGEEL